jgi:cellulose synthase/poly-beta-1,6-N-acetylglucosamine synthase-like glycosyltransferase
MNEVWTSLGVGSLFLLVYVFAGYPALLRLIVRARGPRPVQRAEITPDVSLVISAYNEGATIRAKLDNTLALDYPPSALEIIVVSDTSIDDTDAIVREYAGRVRLARQPERRGKTAGLNSVLPTLAGEIVVFSDANAMYARNALRNLVRNFADPEVGCVTGEARYSGGRRTAADAGERAYWDYEIELKRLETALGSMVGGDGAIYAIRRSLWWPLPETAINDFQNPLQIVAAGYRAVYEPDAICYEETAGGVRTEYRRRVRIVSRSWRAVMLTPAALNPWRVGLFAWSLLSHKVLRWLSGLFAAMVAIAAGALCAPVVARMPLLSAATAIAAALLMAVSRGIRGRVAMLAYFAVINMASLVGVVNGTLGRVSGVWSTPRQVTRTSAAVVPAGQIFLLVAAIVGVGATAAPVVFNRVAALEALFWGSVLLLGYVYAGYPLVIGAMRRMRACPVRSAEIEPTVCLFITANDEEAVIAAKLENALALDYPTSQLQIVVASDGSVDRTTVIARQFGDRVRLLDFAPRRGKIAAINAGMRLVSSDIVVFSDANAFLERGAIRAIARNFADSRVGAVSGDVVLEGERGALGRSEDLYYRYERWLQQAESGIGSMVGADGALYAIRRELFEPPPDDTILDDMAIPMAVVRSGHRVVFESEARAREQGSQTAWEEFTRKSRVIAGAVQFLTRHDSSVPRSAPQMMLSLTSHKILRWVSPAFATCALLTSIALAGTSPTYAIAAWAQALLISCGLAGCVPAFRRLGAISVAHYFCLVQVAAVCGLLRGLAGRQSVLWRRFVRVTG